ncbi:hypothetical protein COU62_00205 [Candidatus Pacearchaeota archaeon CG10_big_fil_rev_8_21_14_0_10_35_219]|nr:glycosyltransferase family 2 protein [Candidatus Pacearchaeota archaeon]OIO41829.1 MAG: hypothetical protein AUJ63_04705 [Candidatus Pacearchaeota archaeon CG1_02_35_32]PIO08497.1 MAG: hypothetical protein COU62_00205 [Candidatus Pacearchaeota archaeon CG10_big_fil_rev_8_21_14_0_10_35_219]PIY81800.1 MAG: hypothetical protein COY79_00665 [Candidatus Pacearchaeota archaeon CG_4_10_14_0_8_um_filter_35_169]PIZ80083.1 MAG: hypothetical protein COY00_02330 [Candidatus Pacearchaeota archaeon CG_4_1
MVNSFVDFVFFAYVFIGLYMLALFVFIYFPNRKKVFDYPPGRIEGVTIVIPCYNEAKEIGAGIKSLVSLDWPKDKLEIIVVDDKSTDNSVEVVRKYVKKYDNVKLIVNERNSGGAAEPRNIGIRASKFDYVAVADADSTPNPDALKKMIGFLQTDKKVGAVTCTILTKNPKTFIQKLQAIEYAVIAFNRKLLDMVDAVYVTPGPFALYDKKVLFEVGLFDVKNMTEDIEISWKMMSRGYLTRMSLATRTYSETPNSFKKWWKQRIRWNIGGKQTLWKYRKYLFRRHMLGFFVVPWFATSLFLGVFGLGLFAYLIFKRVLVSYLSTKYSIYASSTIVSLQDLTFSPSILNFFGGVLFVLGGAFTILSLTILSDSTAKNNKIFNILFYLTIYLALYPFIVVHAIYKMIRRNYTW